MIITLKDTTSSQVASRLVGVREDRGATALGRVLTLIIVVPDSIDVDRAIEISDAASREHPCRVVVVVDNPDLEAPTRLNAQIRVGTDEVGPSDVVILEPHGDASRDLDTLVMPLVLPDTPVVTFWPDTPPENPGEHPLGEMAARRITDSRQSSCPMRTLVHLSGVYSQGDTDFAWSAVTLWRSVLATVVEEFRTSPRRIRVTGHATQPSSFLVAAWLARATGVETVRETDPEAETITGVHFEFEDGTEVALTRRSGSSVAHLTRSGMETSFINLPRRPLQDCLMEELRRLDPDRFYARMLTEDLPRMPAVLELLDSPQDADV